MLAAVAWPTVERVPLFGDLAISPHGIGVAAGFVLGGWIMIRRARRSGIGAEVGDVGEAVSRLLTWIGVGAILGARGFYVLNHLDAYADDPLSALAIWHGGLTLLGGIIGGAIAGIILIRRQAWRAGSLVDAAAPGLAAGIAVGRLGDLAIGDHIGVPAPDFPLAWRCTGNLWERTSNSFGFVPPQPYPEAGAPVQGCFDVPVIQTALFDVLAAAVTLLAILAVERWIRQRPVGTLAAAFVVVYGIGRLVFDVFREDARYGGLTASQWTALAAVAVAVGWWLWARRRPIEPHRTGPTALLRPSPTTRTSMSTDRFTPVKPQRRRQRRSAMHLTGLILLIAGILLFAASSLGARSGLTVLPFDPHHIIGQLAGAGFGLVGASLIGRRQQ